MPSILSPRARSAAVELVLLLGGAMVLSYLIARLGLWALPVVGMLILTAAACYRPDLALAVMVFLLPFTAIEGVASGYQTTIQTFKKLAAVIVLVAWAAHLMLARRRPALPRMVAIPVLLLGVVALLAVLRAPARDVAITSTGRLMLYAGVYVIALIDLTRERSEVWRLVRLLLISASITGLFAVYQFAAHFAGWRTFMNPLYETYYLLPRVHSFMQEPLWLSNYLLLVLPIAGTLFCWKAGRWPRLSGLTVAVSAAALVLAASRLGWACALLAIPLFLASAMAYVRPGRLAFLGAGAAFCLMLVGAGWVRRFGSAGELVKYLTEFATFATPEGGLGDLQGRLRMLPLIADGLHTSPVIGIGTNNVGFSFFREMNLDQPRISSTNNTYLDAFLETGGIGLCCFLWLIWISIRSAWAGFRRYRGSEEGALFLGLGLGVLTMALHMTNWSGWREAHVWFAFGIALAASRAFAEKPGSVDEPLAELSPGKIGLAPAPPVTARSIDVPLTRRAPRLPDRG